MPTNNKQKGSALVSALFIMTLVAIMATAISTQLQLSIYQTRLSLMSDKLYLASQAVTFWAMDELTNKKNRFTVGDSSAKVATFPTKLQALYPDALIQGNLYDLQAHFNLNNLLDKQYQPFFIRLLELVSAKINSEKSKELSSAIRSWLMPYQPGIGNNKFFTYYLRQKPGYFPSQQPMQHISELRLIKGVSAKGYQELLPYVVALPEVTAININTAPKKLLMALGHGLNTIEINELIDARGKKGVSDMKKLLPLLKKLNINPTQITIESQYFMSMAIIQTKELSFISYVLIKKEKDKQGKPRATILSEYLNSYA